MTVPGFSPLAQRLDAMIADYASVFRDALDALRRNRIRISILVVAGAILIVASFGLQYVVGGTPDEVVLQIVPGLAVEIFGAVLFFVILDYGIQRIGELNLFGIREFPQLPAFDFMESVAHRSKRVVRILDTWSYLTNEPDYWPRFREAVREALRRGVRVEMLLAKPGSAGARKRAQELTGVVDVAEELEFCIRRASELARDAETAGVADGLSIRLYSSDAVVTMHMWDEDAYWSFFPPRDRADTNPHLMVSLRTQLGGFLGNEFQTKWSAEDTISLGAFLSEASW